MAAINGMFSVALTNGLTELEYGLGNIDGASPVVYLIRKGIRLLWSSRYEAAMQCATVLNDFCREKLYEGNWRDVPHIWRQLYTFCTVMRIASLCLGNWEGLSISVMVSNNGYCSISLFGRIELVMLTVAIYV